MIKTSEITRKWYVIDAKDKPLGRLASEISVILTGKNKPIYTPHMDCGDFVIVLNADKVLLTGDKLNNKKYYNHSQYAGGLRTRSAKVMIEKYPVEMFERAVWGMLPKGRLGRKMYKKLFVYTTDTHPHTAQQPVVLELKI
ncbi:TPA: 50S ribosomal protein L13 [bacterium]|nr:50S ribosomal protein L13 [bacterium]